MLGLGTKDHVDLCFFSRKPSPTCQITNGTSGGIRRAKLLGPRRVRGGSIALLKVNDSQKKQQYTKTGTGSVVL